MALRTLLDTENRRSILHRLHRLRPDSAPTWGRLDAPRMLCHVADQMRVGLGDIPSVPTHNAASRSLLRFFVVNTGIAPPRGKIETAPEMLSSAPSSWERDLSACIDLVERVGRGSANAVHPAFGPLSAEEWGRLSWKHLNHHLVQFSA